MMTTYTRKGESPLCLDCYDALSFPEDAHKEPEMKEPSNAVPKFKLRWTLLPWTIRLVIAVLTKGAAKHGDFGYKHRSSVNDELDAAMRHITAHLGNEHIDSDSGEMHLAHAAARILIALAIYFQPGADK
jgi:hypothetical protein